jgi:hypothetical protein
MTSNTNIIVHTSISVAIEFLTFCFISFQLLTPILGNPSWVNQVTKTEQQYLSRVSRVSQDNNTDRRSDQVSQVNRVSRVGKTEQKTGSSSRAANMKSWVMEKLANTKSWVIENSANAKSRVTQNSANTKSRIMEILANTENWVMQDLGGRKPEERKGAAPSKSLAPRWCPRGITNTQKLRLQKMHQ